MARIYPWEVEALVDVECGGVMGYYTKGHHDRARLAEWVAKEEEREVLEEEVAHRWCRWGLVMREDGNWARVLMEGRQGTRGVFPVTLINLRFSSWC